MPLFDPPRQSESDLGSESQSCDLPAEVTKDVFVDTGDKLTDRIDIKPIDWSAPEITFHEEESECELSVFSKVGSAICWALSIFLSFCTAVLFLIVFSNSISLVRDIAALPDWMQWVCYSMLVSLVAIAVCALLRLVVIYAQFASSTNFRVDAIEEMNSRDQVRSAEKSSEAVSKLKEFLANYSDDEAQRKFLKQCARGEAVNGQADPVNELYSKIQELGQHSLVSDSQWIENVDEHVLQFLDGLAKNKIRRAGWLVATKTAISPSGTVDSIIVVANTWVLIGDLCRIYSVRPNWFETSIFLCWSSLNTFISYRADEVSSQVEDSVNSTVGSIMNYLELGKDLAGGVALKMAGKFVTKAAEGASNGVLITKLGYYLQRKLRPIRRS